MANNYTDIPNIVGSQHIHLKRVNSTNKYATDMVSKSKPVEGTVISAAFQYEGRGQIGRFWESEASKNITCSTILRPMFLEARYQFQLNMAISIAVADTVRHYIDKTISVKWPNDIYVDDKKIAGILIQNTLKGKTIDTSVIGIGININQEKFSDDIPNPTSLKLESEQEVELADVFTQLFENLNLQYARLKNDNQELEIEYLDRLYRKDIPSQFILENDVESQGIIRGIDDTGQLIVEIDAAQKHFGFREIKFVI